MPVGLDLGDGITLEYATWELLAVDDRTLTLPRRDRPGEIRVTGREPQVLDRGRYLPYHHRRRLTMTSRTIARSPQCSPPPRWWRWPARPASSSSTSSGAAPSIAGQTITVLPPWANVPKDILQTFTDRPGSPSICR